ncbi:MAG: hypothetical protein DWQ01_07050 [Planctomycetota bacterium]|nr:MAG: hypothetical protein DWQ01_07050 [Planctomycetota bacterium]
MNPDSRNLEASLRRLDEYLELRRTGASPEESTFLEGVPEDMREDLADLLRDQEFFDWQLGKGIPGLQPGDVLGDFRLQREIGSGGMSVVWEAEQISLGRKVALKFLAPPVANLRWLTRLQREARAGARLAHPGIVQIHSVGTERGCHFLVQELVPGERNLAKSLAQRRSVSRPTWPDFRRIAGFFLELAETMEFAHQAGVIHRDIKPSNILIAPSGKPKISDFGLAMLSGDPSVTGTGEFLGTPYYVSPEQAMYKRVPIDARTDIFSLGVTFFEALTLQRAFDGDSIPQVLDRILHFDPPDPRRLRSQIPRDLAVICMKAMEKNPDRRYRSMKALAEDLRCYLADLPISAQPISRLRMAGKWLRRHPIISYSGAIASVSFLAILILLVQVQTARTELEALTSQVFELSDDEKVLDLMERADRLWPLDPEFIPDYEQWLQEAERLLLRLPVHRARLEDVQAGRLSSGEGRESIWWSHTLRRLIERLEELSNPELGLIAGIHPKHGLGIKRRLSYVESVQEKTVSGPEVGPLWQEAMDSISDVMECPRYGGLSIQPQAGLVPIRRNPKTGLWEFFFPLSGGPPQFEGTRMKISEDTGLVFVLLPEAEFLIGAQNKNSDEPGYDEQASALEGEPHSVFLSAFFISKYELTQGQWQRLMGVNPAFYSPSNPSRSGEFTLTHPVEQVNWDQCNLLLKRLGLSLPTEAQWEYAARAGTSGPRWTGQEAETLEGAENLCDDFAKSSMPGGWQCDPWHDGYLYHAPVGSFRPNDFGLYDVLGNVFEWCLETMVPYGGKVKDGTGERIQSGDTLHRVQRGGSWRFFSALARSGFRYARIPTTKSSAIGCRPVRLLDRPE